MSWTLAFSNLLILLIVYYIGYVSFKPRFSRKYRCILFISIYLFQLSSNFYGPSHISTFVTFINFLLITLLLFKSSKFEGLLISTFSLLFISTSEFLAMLIMNFLFNLTHKTSINSLTYFFSLLLSDILFYFISILFIKIKQINNYIKLPKYYWTIIFIPLSSITLFMYISNYFSILENNKKIIVSFILLTFSNIVTLILFYKAVKSIKIKEELHREKESKEKVLLEFDLYSKYYFNNFNLTHTLLHSYSELHTLLNEKKYNQLNEKLEELSQKTFQEFNSLYSESLILNMLISKKINILKKYNIIINTKFTYSDFSFFDFTDQSTFFDCILEISIHACKDFSSSSITIKSSKKNQYIILQIFFPSKENLSILLNANNDLNKILKKYEILRAYKFNDEDKIMNMNFFIRCTND